jgi:hypothetical protein
MSLIKNFIKFKISTSKKKQDCKRMPANLQANPPRPPHPLSAHPSKQSMLLLLLFRSGKNHQANNKTSIIRHHCNFNFGMAPPLGIYDTRKHFNAQAETLYLHFDLKSISQHTLS